MPPSDPTTILVRHNRWAMENLLLACVPLTEQQFHQEFEIGLGSLHDTIVHILGAMRGWGDLLAGREQRPRLEADPPRSIEQLGELLTEISDEVETLSVQYPLHEMVSGSRGGRSYEFTRGAVITHVMTHGMHHRAQCLNMLRHLGVSPLPPSAVVEWVLQQDSA